jgi:hypothetical protein
MKPWVQSSVLKKIEILIMSRISYTEKLSFKHEYEMKKFSDKKNRKCDGI